MRIESARGIGEHQGLDAQGRHQPDREGGLGQGIAFIGMDPAVGQEDRFPGQMAPIKGAAVAGAGGPGEVGQLRIGQRPPARHFRRHELLPGS